MKHFSCDSKSNTLFSSKQTSLSSTARMQTFGKFEQSDKWFFKFFKDSANTKINGFIDLETSISSHKGQKTFSLDTMHDSIQ